MKLNNNKFELLSYSFTKNNNKVLLNELPFQNELNMYIASDETIMPSSLVRDLGVYWDNDLNWNSHYNIIVKKSKQLCA